jgi:large subunit ribosomal protein L4
MAVAEVRSLEGETVGQVELADAVFAAHVNPHLLHETVRWYLAAQRAGTHKTKGRGEVSGSGRKLWRQKGTGRARVGSIRSSIWRKGGTVHGPQPRSYAYRLPRKVVLGALRSALSAKFADGKLTVVDGWTLDSHKTKELRQTLSRLDGQTRTILVVEPSGNRNLELASRNLEGVKVVAPAVLQPYDLLRHERVMLSRDMALHLGSSLGPATNRTSVAFRKPAPAAAKADSGAEVAKPAPEEVSPAKTPTRAARKSATTAKAGAKRKTAAKPRAHKEKETE